MKKLIIFLLFCPLMSFAQVGIKAGYTHVKGFHTGVFYKLYLSDNVFFHPEIIHGIRSFNRKLTWGNNNTSESTESVPYIQIPLSLGVESSGDFKLFGLAGIAPGYFFYQSDIEEGSLMQDKEPSNLRVSGIAEIGILYNNFSFSLRYDALLNKKEVEYFEFGKGVFVDSDSNALMVSVGYIFK